MSRADLNQSAIVKALRSVGATVHITNQVGCGFPDLVVGIFGRNYLMEVKNEETRGRLTAEQIIFLDMWKGKVHIVKSVDEALQIIGVEV